MHRYVSSCIACPPVVSATRNSLLLMIAHGQVFMYVYALIDSKEGGRDLLPRAAAPNLSTTGRLPLSGYHDPSYTRGKRIV